jgi:hypothetical protein
MNYLIYSWGFQMVDRTSCCMYKQWIWRVILIKNWMFVIVTTRLLYTDMTQQWFQLLNCALLHQFVSISRYKDTSHLITLQTLGHITVFSYESLKDNEEWTCHSSWCQSQLGLHSHLQGVDVIHGRYNGPYRRYCLVMMNVKICKYKETG